MRSLAYILFALVPLGSAIFFGGGSQGCGCNSCCAPAPPPCAPPCAPQPVCPAPPIQSCGCSSGGFGGDYAQPQAICPPRYIILQSGSSGGGSIGGSSYSSGPVGGSSYSSGPVGGSSYSSGPVGGGSYSAPVASSYSGGPAPSASSYSSGGTQVAQSQSYSSGQSSNSQQIAAPAPPSDADYSEAAGAVSVSTSTASSATSDHPTYNTNAREYAAKTFERTARCPNVELLHFIDDSIVEGDASESKRKIYKLLNSIFTSEDGKPIDVICASSRISYRLTANLSCEHSKGQITCIAYKQA